MSSHGHAIRTLSEADARLPRKHSWRNLHIAGAAIGVVGLGLAAALGLGDDSRQFFYSYLVAFLFFLSIALGAMFFVLVQFMTRAGWSVVVRRLAENLMGTVPLFALLFIPILLQIDTIFYQWADPEVIANDPHSYLVKHKAGYFDVAFFVGRAIFYLIAWAAIAWFFRKKSIDQDDSGDKQITRSLQMLAAPAIAVFALTSTFAAFDWIMSLDPHWFSTIFGVYFFAGCSIALYATMAVLVIWLRSTGVLRGVVTAEHDHDIGKFLFGFTVFWTYIAFSQYILIWYANIPEETMWYQRRFEGEWYTLSLVLAACHFVVPFFFLMSRHIKRKPLTLLIGAVWMLVMHYLDLYWLVLPMLTEEYMSELTFSLLDVLTFLGVGGLFMAAFAWLTVNNPLVPIKDPRLPESLSHQNY